MPPAAELAHPAFVPGVPDEKIVAKHEVSPRRKRLRYVLEERCGVRRLDEGLDTKSEVDRRWKGRRAEIELAYACPSAESRASELRLDGAVGDTEAGCTCPAEHIFQARAYAATEVEYALSAAISHSGPQKIVHEVKSLLAANYALAPNRSMNDALRAALAVVEKARRVLVVVARDVGAFELHEVDVTA